MTRNEMNLVNMFKTVDWFLDTNKELLKGYQPIIESHGRLKQGLLVLNDLSEAQAKDTKVQTELKSNEKDELDRTMIKVSDAMSAVAAASNNQELKLIANWPKSLLSRLREGDYHIKVQQIYKAALPLASQLLVWGVSAEEIEALNTLSSSFQKRTPDIRNVKVVSKQASTELRSKVAELNMEVKDTLDKLLKPFSNLNPTLYGQYTNARSIVEKAATQAKPKDDTTTVETK
jgi:hypothetical protein